ncbi:hypothetical protein F2P56_000282 [Juglans regia]|nr:hypothetical protein F2P56_000282 [Juglans regia]
MDKLRICEICNKRLANGKAMGGHMRSHLAKLPIPPKPVQQHDNSAAAESTQPSPSPSSSFSLHIHSRKNPMQSYPSLKRRLHLVANSGSESDAESQVPAKKPTRRRSKRCRKTVVPLAESPLEPEQVSSVSDTFSEEDGALCLIMLSRDKGSTKGKEKAQEVVEGIVDDHKDEDHEGTDNYPCHIRTSRPRVKFSCETCSKVFRSYQALGGHKASHKKNKNQFHEEDFKEGNGHRISSHGGCVVDQRQFECPYCSKVFESGQALGGHKKVHLSNLGNARNATKPRHKLIDLNLPAPVDEDEVNGQLVDLSSTVPNADQ